MATFRKFAAETLRRNWRGAILAGAAGVFLAMIGPFGSYAASLGERLFFWVSLMLAGSVCGAVLARVSARRPEVGSNRIWRWALRTLAIAVPMSAFAWLLSRTIFGAGAPNDFPFFFGATLLISAAATALMEALNTPGPATGAKAPIGGAPERDDAAPIRLRARLPGALRLADILAVSAEDHYLRVHTTAGSTLILLRLSEAIAELEGIEGAQVHRSWWVAKSAIIGSRRDGRKLILTIKGDLEAPVSRPNVRALKASAWI